MTKLPQHFLDLSELDTPTLAGIIEHSIEIHGHGNLHIEGIQSCILWQAGRS